MFEYEGQQYTEEEVKKAAEIKGLSLNDYIENFNITKTEEPDPVKKSTTDPGATVEPVIAPTITEPPSENISLESLDADVKTGKLADTLITKERNIEEEKRILEEYNKIEENIIKNNPDYTPQQVKTNADD